MARFWKKPGGREGSPTLFSAGSQSDLSPGRKSTSSSGSASIGIGNGNAILVRSDSPRGSSPDISVKTSPNLKNYEALPSHAVNFKRQSRLSQSLGEVLRDHCARQHFLQFLESADAAHFLQFWLDADSFQVVTKTRLSSYSQQINAVATKCKTETPHPHCDKTEEEGEGGCPERPGRGETCTTGNPEESNQKTIGTTAAKNERLPDSEANNPNANANAGACVKKVYKSIGDDAVNIFTKYIAKDASHPVGVHSDLRDQVTGKICSEDFCVDPTCFQMVQEQIYSLLEKQYFPNFLQSVHYCRHQLDVLTNGSVSLADILYSETSLSFFMEFMEQEGQRDLVEFWLAADNFHQHLVGREGGYNSAQAQDDAMVLYDKYFSLQATCPLEFSQPVRFEVEQNICREEGPLPNCFENAVLIVLTVLEKSYLSQFLGSQLYVKYLTELVNRVQTSHEKTLERRKGSGSDAGSEHGGGGGAQTLNTLLAMDGSQPGAPARRILKKFDDDAMRIDTDLFVPDMLWKRPLAGKLRIGYVNGMGQFITEFEPEPDKRRATGSLLSKAVKKLVYKDEDKTKEEMALQVARMIIHEVLSITLGGRLTAQLCKL